MVGRIDRERRRRVVPRLPLLHRAAAVRRVRHWWSGRAGEARALPNALHDRDAGGARRGLLLHLPQAEAGAGDACGCELPRSRRVGRMLLWIATVLVIGVWSFPYLAERLFG